MGRMLEALKQAETQRLAPRLAPVPEKTSENEGTLAPDTDEAEVPYIEWGPLKSMEASPSVLASPGPGSRAVSVPRIHEAPVALVPPPSAVVFRALPSPKAVGKLAPQLSAFHDPDGPVSAQYRELLQALLVAKPNDESQALLFTAAHAGSGTTTTLLNTAISAARLGRRRIAVVDANTLKPAVAAALGVMEKPGLREVLAGVTPLHEALQETAQVNLQVLTAGITRATGGVRFLAETTRSLLRQLRQRFDLIFVDAPAWDGTAETTNLAVACDAVYLVLSPAEVDTPKIDELIRLVPTQGGKLAGCIIAG